MATFLIRRFFQSLVFIFLAGFVVYTVLVMLMPDEPYYRYTHNLNLVQVGVKVETPEEAAERYELDKPWPLNFLAWLFDPGETTTTQIRIKAEFEALQKTEIPSGIDLRIGDFHIQGSGALTGDFGYSVTNARSSRPVSQLIGERFGNTFWLVLASITVALLIGIPLGIISASRPNSRLDHAITFLSFASLSVPPFALGLFLIIGLAVFPSGMRLLNDWNWLPNLPPGGIGDDNFVDRLRHLILPAATLAIPQIAALSRYARFSMLDVLRQEYIRTAWAKGLSRTRIYFKHVFRNAIIPVITIVGLLIPGIVSGAILVETLFAYPGMGQLYYRGLGGCIATAALQTQEPPPCPRIGYFPIDYPVALTLSMILIIIVTLANVLADALYAAADPRISYRSATRS